MFRRQVVYQSLAFVAAAAGTAVGAAMVISGQQTIFKTATIEECPSFFSTGAGSAVPGGAMVIAAPQNIHQTVLFEEKPSYVHFAPGNATAGSATIAAAQYFNKSIVYEGDTSFVSISAPGTSVGGTMVIAAHQRIDKAIPYLDRPTYLLSAAETITVDKWYRQLDVPTRRKLAQQSDGAYSYTIVAAQSETITADKWWKELAQPVRIRVVQQPNYYAQPPQAAPGDSVGAAMVISGQQSILKTATIEELPSYFSIDGTGTGTGGAMVIASPQVVSQTVLAEERTSFALAPEVATASTYFSMAGTISGQIFDRSIVYESDAYTPYQPVVAETITIDKWFRELDRPVRRLPITWRQVEARDPFPQVPWGWHPKLEDPTRLKRFTGQLSYTFVAPAPGNATTQNWFHQLDTPVRARKLYEYPALAIPVYFVPPSPGSGSEYNWWQQLDEPIRPRKSIRTDEQQGYTIPPKLETITLDGYYWYQPLTTPTRLKLAFGQYPAVAQGNVYPLEDVTIDKWYRGLDLPIWTRKLNRSDTAQGNINPIVPFVHLPLHSPHRLKGRIEYPALHRPLFPFSFPGTGLGTQQPWPALSEPVRFRSQIHPGRQVGYAFCPISLTTVLDAACRVLTPEGMYVTLAGDGASLIITDVSRTVTPDADEDTVTPEDIDIVEVKC